MKKTGLIAVSLVSAAGIAAIAATAFFGGFSLESLNNHTMDRVVWVLAGVACVSVSAAYVINASEVRR